MALVLDTGPLLAALDEDDPDHARSAALIDGADEDLVVPTLVLGELAYWLRRRFGVEPWLTFLDDVIEGAYGLVSPSQTDLVRCRELEERYANLGLGLVDASVIALVERLGEPKVATLDHRHFATVRPAHVRSLVLLPEGPSG